MLSSSPSEERYPLLLLFLEDTQRSSKHKRILIDKNRYHGIASGASAVITQWPGHLTTCWLTALVIGLTIIFASMMLFAIALRPAAYLLSVQCKNTHSFDSKNPNHSMPIHLVHGPTPWFQSQLDTLEEIAQNYPMMHIELIIIQEELDYADSTLESKTETLPGVFYNITTPNGLVTAKNTNTQSTSKITTLKSLSTSKATGLEKLKTGKKVKKHPKTKRNRKKRQMSWEKIQMSINVGASKLLKMFLGPKDFHSVFQSYQHQNETVEPKLLTDVPRVHTIQDIIKLYPNIHRKNSTYEEIFKYSPLHLYWQKLNQVTRLFAIRVLQIWNFGGITFDLPEFSNTTSLLNSTKASNNTTNISTTQISFEENEFRYKNLIIIGLPSFEQLPEGIVTVDDNGLHMETKTICHAFFGEILINFKDATLDTTPADIIKKALRTFCKSGAVDRDYCKTIAK